MSEQYTDMIASALFAKTRRSILSLLFTHTDREYYKREIIRHVTAGRGAVDRELENLESAGIIRKIKKGREHYYSANPKCPVFTDLKGLIVKTSGVADVIRKALEPMRKKIKLAFIYGSIAQGLEDSQSDIDLMIVGDIKLEGLFKALSDAHYQLRRVTNPHTISAKEFNERMKKSDDFVARIWRNPKIILIGDEDEFTGMV